MDQLYGEMQKRAAELEIIKETLTKHLRTAPVGTLRTNTCKGHVQYYHRKDKADRYGSYLGAKDMELITSLAQKGNDELELRAVEAELRAIQSYLSKYPKVSLEEVYGTLTPVRKALVSPFVETDEMFLARWRKQYHTDESFSRGFPEYMTDRGEFVRSKSEVIIANMLNRLEVPYCYEPAVVLRGIGIVHPDFAALDRRQRKTCLIEHLGMMGDLGYMALSVRKYAGYIMSGYYPGEQLILTMETEESPLNVQTAERLFRRQILHEV